LLLKDIRAIEPSLQIDLPSRAETDVG